MTSPLRPQQRINRSDIRSFIVDTAKTIRQGMPIVLSGTSGTAARPSIAEVAAITDDAIGIAYEQETNVPQTTAIPGQGWTAPAGAVISVVLFGQSVVPVLVGTGGTTIGKPQRAAAAANGITDATVGGGTGKIFLVGQAMETGVAGDLAGVNLALAGWSVGS